MSNQPGRWKSPRPSTTRAFAGASTVAPIRRILSPTISTVRGPLDSSPFSTSTIVTSRTTVAGGSSAPAAARSRAKVEAIGKGIMALSVTTIRRCRKAVPGVDNRPARRVQEPSMSASGVGRRARLDRLFDPASGRQINVALDHGNFGLLAGVEEIVKVIEGLLPGKPDSIQLPPGSA